MIWGYRHYKKPPFDGTSPAISEPMVIATQDSPILASAPWVESAAASGGATATRGHKGWQR